MCKYQSYEISTLIWFVADTAYLVPFWSVFVMLYLNVHYTLSWFFLEKIIIKSFVNNNFFDITPNHVLEKIYWLNVSTVLWHSFDQVIQVDIMSGWDIKNKANKSSTISKDVWFTESFIYIDKPNGPIDLRISILWMIHQLGKHGVTTVTACYRISFLGDNWYGFPSMIHIST